MIEALQAKIDEAIKLAQDMRCGTRSGNVVLGLKSLQVARAAFQRYREDRAAGVPDIAPNGKPVALNPQPAAGASDLKSQISNLKSPA